MSRLAVMAHFDVEGGVRPPVRGQVLALAASVDRLVVCSTARLQPEARAWLQENAELIERANYGYDFFSYKWGLDLVPEYPDFDHVVVSNDTFIGPSVPLRHLLESPQAQKYDVMGMTLSLSHGAHAQSQDDAAKTGAAR